jgi:GDP-L-fucose synthase
VVAGSGKPLRQFIFSEDLANIILALLFEETPLEPAYIACDMETELSIQEVAETIATAVGFMGDTVLDTSKADGIFRKTASNKKLKLLLSDKLKFTPFANGISQTVHWYLKNESVARK